MLFSKRLKKLSTYFRKHVTHFIQQQKKHIKIGWKIKILYTFQICKIQNIFYHPSITHKDLHFGAKNCIQIVWWCLTYFVSFVYFWLTKKTINFVGDHPMNIPTKLGSNWPSCSEKKINMYQFTDDDGRQVIPIPHMNLWFRWANKMDSRTNHHLHSHQGHI